MATDCLPNHDCRFLPGTDYVASLMATDCLPNHDCRFLPGTDYVASFGTHDDFPGYTPPHGGAGFAPEGAPKSPHHIREGLDDRAAEDAVASAQSPDRGVAHDRGGCHKTEMTHSEQVTDTSSLNMFFNDELFSKMVLGESSACLCPTACARLPVPDCLCPTAFARLPLPDSFPHCLPRSSERTFSAWPASLPDSPHRRSVGVILPHPARRRPPDGSQAQSPLRGYRLRSQAHYGLIKSSPRRSQRRFGHSTMGWTILMGTVGRGGTISRRTRLRPRRRSWTPVTRIGRGV